MGHEGMALAAVRYLRAMGEPTSAAPLPPLRAVRPDERAAVDSGEFRRVLGHFASGVTVVTAPGGAEPGEEAPAGFACQSFSSLSLDPPLVTFLVARTSGSWPRIARAGVFSVNVLAAGQGDLCMAFAAKGTDKFAGVDWTPSPANGSPRLAGALAWVDCAIHAVHTGGDHLIVVGRVETLETNDGVAPEPLLFFKGGFGGFGS